jgi:hypothetical protein
MSNNRWYSSPAVWVAVATGAICAIIVNNISTGISHWAGIYLPVSALFFLGCLLEYCFPGRTMLIGLGVLGGIAVGVLVDVNLDWLLRGRDRNLWPLEIAMWWVLGPAPLFIGAILVRILRKWRLRRK